MEGKRDALIVVGRGQRRGRFSMFSTSVSRQVVRHAAAPVVVVELFDKPNARAFSAAGCRERRLDNRAIDCPWLCVSGRPSPGYRSHRPPCLRKVPFASNIEKR